MKGSSFGRWCFPLVLKIENWGNGLLIGMDHSKFTKYCPGNAYWLSSLERESHKRFIDGKYLKKYFMLDTAKKN